MSRCFCEKSTGVTVDVPTLIRDKLSIIPSIYPNTRYSCILSNSGDLIVINPIEELVSASLLSTICSMRSSVSQFASSLSPTDCPVIHITGKSHMFSCYDVGSFILAFYTEIDSESFSTFGVAESDERVLELVAELRLILKNAIIVRSESAI